MNLKAEVTQQIALALGSLGKFPEAPEVRLEYARDEKFGDYACTIAMDRNFRELAAQLDPGYKNPRNLATAIIAALEVENQSSGFFNKIELAGAGFINLTVSDRVLFRYATQAIQSAKEYGQSSIGDNRKIIFEFISANPTGPLNVVSSRAAALGDTCCNLLSSIGYQVTREYYVNDYGNQVDLLGVSCMLRDFEQSGVALKFASKDGNGDYIYDSKPGLPFPAEGYHGEYLSEITAELIQKNPALRPSEELLSQAQKLAESDAVDLEFYRQGQFAECASEIGKAATAYFLSLHQADLEKFRVKFESFFSERTLHENNDVLKVKEGIKQKIYESDGKEFFRSTDYGDDRDRVIVREDGRPTYLLADIAYHNTKIKRGFDKIYNIWGPDHHGYIRRLVGAVSALGFPEENFKILIAQQVSLLENGEPVVMSKRAGKFVTMKSLMEEVPVDVLRYFFVMRAFESHLDFDFAEARDTSEKNPYYYVAYAHARIRSIFEKVRDTDLLTAESSDFKNNPPTPPGLTPTRRRLLWLVARFPEEIQEAGQNLEPHRLTTYLYQLASSLAKFYGPPENKIIAQTPEVAAGLLYCLEAVAVCLKNGLGLLGASAPDRM